MEIIASQQDRIMKNLSRTLCLSFNSDSYTIGEIFACENELQSRVREQMKKDTEREGKKRG